MIPYRSIVGIVGAVGYSILLLYWGNEYGPKARELAGIVAAQAEKNGRLEQQVKDDASLYASETADAAKRLAAYKAALETLKNCPLEQADVDAINTLIGD